MIKELRIGNLVKSDDHHYNQFHNEGIVTLIQEDKFTVNNHYPGKWFEGIPVTEEWLIKLGFEPRNEHRGIGAIYDLKHKHIEDKINGWKFGKAVAFVHDKEDVKDVYLTCLANPTAYKLKYVHQLQNLYFALTGEELEHKIKKSHG